MSLCLVLAVVYVTSVVICHVHVALFLSAAKIFGGVLIRNPSAAWRQRNNMSLETLDRRKTTFVYHFLVNEIDI